MSDYDRGLIVRATDKLLRLGYRGISFKPTKNIFGETVIEYYLKYHIDNSDRMISKWGSLDNIPSSYYGFLVDGFDDCLEWDMPF